MFLTGFQVEGVQILQPWRIWVVHLLGVYTAVAGPSSERPKKCAPTWLFRPLSTYSSEGGRSAKV
jgi:hypothetical protein